MATYSIDYSDEVVSILEKLPKTDRIEIIKRIEKLGAYPEHIAYSLTGTKLSSMRAGDYRVLVAIDKKLKKVFIVTVGHRKKVYDRKL
jgi:mRNA interferase RelE/StbE